MRKGTAMIVAGGILLLPPALALGLTALMSTSIGPRLLSLFGFGEFLIYWDPLVALSVVAVGSTLVLVGLRRRVSHKGRI